MIEVDISKTQFFFDGEVSSSILKFKAFLEESRKNILKAGTARKKILIACKSIGILEGFKRLFTEYEINYITLKHLKDLCEVSPKYIGLCLYDVEEGFETDEFLMIADSGIIGKQIASAKQKKQANLHKLKISANQFNIGDLIVHKDYGIGLFEGVNTLEHAGNKYDAVKLVYQNRDTLYVPIYNINQITKFGNEVREEEKLFLLDKLGGTSWKIRKAKTKTRIFAIAEGLMKLAAKRNLTKAKVFAPIPGIYDEFEKSFPFELTEDQKLAISDVLTDLSSEKAMERLICGDVGFGKTEIAMRAAFITSSGRLIAGYNFGQVAIIVPTTILARQHFNNFIERFKGTELVIKELSRNISNGERQNTLLQAELGEIDILIGTHALFSEKLKFKNLQLLIIDEEQHFGVKQKEKLKEGKESIHFLSLSATPIPRTLQMSLAGIRDISIISTPPFDRILPKTFLMPYDEIVLCTAILREKARGGRVFFVAPRISDLEEQKLKLESMLPEVKFAIAHGRMTTNKMEDVMLKFYEGYFDVLVTTSIIESGLDISFANTIIIYKADMFGLGNLYQLRGRVGRGAVQSYAYFIVDEKHLATENQAKQRLMTLVNIKNLGGGFKIAGVDMDIRGCGNLVGEEQSGKINEVGIELYQEMLLDAVNHLKVHKEIVTDEDFTPEIKIGMGVMIPEAYIPDFNLRLEFYRRISAVSSKIELEMLNEEMEDRFGKLPIDTKNLISITNIKIKCKELGIAKFEVGPKGCTIQAKENIFKITQKLLEFAIKKPNLMKLNPENKIIFYDEKPDLLQKANEVLKTCESLLKESL